MKKYALLLTLVCFAFGASAQGKIATYKYAYIWAQGNRSSGSKGSAFSSKDGQTYSLVNVLKKTSPKAIDILCAYAKIDKKAEVGFCLFAPMTPDLEVNWDKNTGTIPYRYFEAPSSDPSGQSSLEKWAVRNATKIMTVTDIDFDNATYDSIAAIEMEENSYIAKNLEIGAIVAFETAATSSNPSKKGLIKIIKINDDERAEKVGQGNFQQLEMIVKVQK